jgi:hypothetical protein
MASMSLSRPQPWVRGHTANRHQNLISSELTLAPGAIQHAHCVARCVEPLNLAAHVHLHTQLAQRGGHGFGQILVVQRQDMVLRFDHGHVGTELAVDQPQLQPDIAATYHYQLARNALGRQSLCA